MKKILLSLGMIVFVGALVAGATGAFFSDTETSTGNTFTAGALDLKVDSEAHYNGMVCRITAEGEAGEDGEYAWHAGFGFPNDAAVPADHYPQPGMACDGTWTETDLGPEFKFFNLTDIKPGDFGENTISLHVYDNDAWGRFVISNVQDVDNTCTEPEEDSLLDSCTEVAPELLTAGSGELADVIDFYAWVDQGATAGFQNVQPGEQGYVDTNEDPTEGDNIWQCEIRVNDTIFETPTLEAYLAALQTENPFNGSLANCDEPLVILPGGVDAEGETHNIWPALAAVDAAYCPNGEGVNATGHNDYGLCHGIADDGRMVGSTTYYFGLAWNTDDVGNEAQTDSLNADLTFEVEQHRNNTNPFDE